MRLSLMGIGLLLYSFPVYTAFAQEHGPSAVHGPAILLSGMGSHSFPITTRNSEAQRFFDQGLALLYGFNHDEAVRSFRRAGELDRQAAMPHWGIALALGPNYNLPEVDVSAWREAQDELAKAQALLPGATERERAYVEALARRIPADLQAEKKKLLEDYAEAMKALVQRYPDDLDAATLYAESQMNLRPWQLWNSDGTPAPGTAEIVALLESVLKRNPDHPGANHYYIHAVEASRNPEQALPSAERLRNLTPGAGHLVHMPAHIYIRTGDFEAAARSNERAAEVDQSYIRRTGAKGIYPLMYYSHNLHFIAISRAEQGRFDQARAAADRLARHVAPSLKEMPMVEGFLTVSLTVLLRFHRSDDILKVPAPSPDRALTKTMRHYARTIAFLEKRSRQEAERERQLFESARAAIPADAYFGLSNTAQNVFKVAAAILDARLAGNPQQALGHWREAAAAQDALVYDEPPAWYYPVRESLGGALLRDGQPGEAEGVFRQELEHNPRNPRVLFGLWHSLEAQGKRSDAELVHRQFQASWTNATVQLRIEDL